MRLPGHNLVAPAVVYSEGKQYDVNEAERKESQELMKYAGGLTPGSLSNLNMMQRDCSA
jgi:hypothetical protein